jgi:hypothetical protein
MSHQQWTMIPLAIVATSAQATEYFSVEQVQQAIYPAAKLSPAAITLSDEQVQHIEQLSGIKVPYKELKAWKVAGGGWLLIDQVIGKHELITYALGINANGTVKQLEIMDYLETYGYAIRTPAWRHQFVGKSAASKVTLNQDIVNISGATLSSQHLTEGVKRLLATYAVALK